MAGIPHPREMLSLIGHAEAEREFLEGWQAGRLHHAWLITGLHGIGKATLAYRMARFLLAQGGEVGSAATDLAVAGDNPVAHQVASGGHPDLAVIRRTLNAPSKTFSTEIKVDDVRKGLDVFNKTAAAGGYRIAIVDACDDLNASSANALLKTLEEPPKRSLFILIAHNPGRLLPTIRSRCRMLTLRPLSDDEIAAGLAGMPGLNADHEVSAAATREAGGSLRRALTMLDARKLDFHMRVRAVLNALPQVNALSLDTIAEMTTGRVGDDAYDSFCDLSERWMSEQLQGPAARLDIVRLAQCWSHFGERRREVDTLNLDRRPFVVETIDGFSRLFAR